MDRWHTLFIPNSLASYSKIYKTMKIKLLCSLTRKLMHHICCELKQRNGIVLLTFPLIVRIKCSRLRNSKQPRKSSRVFWFSEFIHFQFYIILLFTIEQISNKAKKHPCYPIEIDLSIWKLRCYRHKHKHMKQKKNVPILL